MNNIFTDVYPFTTEDISRYFPIMDLEDKTVLTVGSSGDQAFNAILHGASKVTIMDINPLTEGFVKLKRDKIMNNSRRSLYYETIRDDSYPLSHDVFSLNNLELMSPYMSDDYEYERLRSRLKDTNIDFVQGDIFKMNKSLTSNDQFDRILLSNVLQYVDFYMLQHECNDLEEFIRSNFDEWVSHLNDDGLLQLMYYYSVVGQKRDLVKMCKSLCEKELSIYTFNNALEQGKSAVLYYRK